MITLKETSEGVKLKVRVSCGKKSFEVRGFDSWSNSLLLSTKEPAEQGKANKEIKTELKKVFGKEIKITSGKKSHNKTLLVKEKPETVKKVLSQLVD